MMRSQVRFITMALSLAVWCSSVMPMSGGAASQADSLEATLRRMRERLETVDDYRCLYSSFAVKGNRRENVLMRYFYKRPGWIRAEILRGDHKGTVLLARRGKVRVRPRGILSITSFTFQADHPRVTDLRGNRLEETCWAYFIDEHLRELDWLSLVSTRRETVDGREARVLEAISSDPARTRGIAREILWVCAAEDILLRFEMYDSQDRPVQKGRFSEIVLNPGLPDSLFTQFRTK